MQVFKLFKNFLLEEEAQISIETIILMAAMLAMAVILITQLQKSATTAAGKVDTYSNKAFDQLDQAAGLK